MKKVLGGILVGCLCLAAGCRKDLCYDHDRHGLTAGVAVRTSWECVWERSYGRDWSENWPAHFEKDYEALCPSPATGVAAVVYNEDGSRGERHLPAEGGLLPMTEGEHEILFYNDDTEYIVFNGLESQASASAATRTRTRASYSELHAGEETVNTPDVLYASWTEAFDAARTEVPADLPVMMRPLVYSYLVHYEFESGLEHVVLARGALSGMAGSVYLRDGRTCEEPSTLLYDCELKECGAEAVVNTFGVCSSPGKLRQDGRHYGLNLEVRLRNGKFKTFEFDVTDQVAAQPRGGVVVVGGLAVSDEEAGGGAGFDVEVDGWGEYEDIDLPLQGK